MTPWLCCNWAALGTKTWSTAGVLSCGGTALRASPLGQRPIPLTSSSLVRAELGCAAANHHVRGPLPTCLMAYC
ncbi:hypothetical protein HaLaN_27157 [Haematococcus lacustris]|uniref:Secreted protein n=1 Tax=Haematococcus lacustris TaxID=44745 RepID=A0A6A0A7Z8_HAELA|nr:hypothetical protein HaLaN_27157 [Haematococcus lacustris]